MSCATATDACAIRGLALLGMFAPLGA